MRRYLIIALSFFVVPVLLFGNPFNIIDSILLIVCTSVMAFFINYKAIESKEWPFYILSFLIGSALSFFGVSVFGIVVRDPIISITANFQSIPAILSIIGFILFSKLYRERKKLEYLKQFDNDTLSLERDKKINKIIGNWFE